MKAYITNSGGTTQITLKYDKAIDSVDVRHAIVSTFKPNAEIHFSEKDQEVIADIICYRPLNFIMVDVANLTNLVETPEKRVLVAW